MFVDQREVLILIKEAENFEEKWISRSFVEVFSSLEEDVEGL